MDKFLRQLRRRDIYRAPTVYALVALVGCLVIVLALAYQRTSGSSGTTIAQQHVNAPAAQSAVAAISIAVLPFLNLSDATQEFFSDGMTEEITAALTKVQGLRVVGRVSAFQFKGQNQDLRGLGQSLGANYVVSGSVFKADDRVRVAVELIKTDGGTKIWTDNFDGQLADIFATQEEIAKAIAGALLLPVTLQQGEALVSDRTDDLDSYQRYLRAKALVRSRSINQAIAILEPAVERDPDYAPAWALLAEAYAFVPGYEMGVSGGSIEASRRVVRYSLERAEMAARKAISLEPRLASGHTALGQIESFRGDWAASEDNFRQALMIDPAAPNALHLYGLMLLGSGRLRQALDIRNELRALEPVVPVYNVMTALVVQMAGPTQSSIAMLEAVPVDNAVGYYRNVYLATVHASTGRFAEAADTLLAIPEETQQVPRRSIEEAARLLRRAPIKVREPEALPTLEAELNFVYGYVDAFARVLEAPERNLDVGLANGTVNRSVWRPIYASLRNTERFKAYVRNAGLVAYWRERGWPDLCRPQGANDFVCN